jgi:penicillin-binding protein 1A
LQSALVQSINTVYAPLGVQVGLRRVVRLAKASGLQVGHLDSGQTCGVHKGKNCPSYALGIPISPLSEADAYGTLVNHGVHQPVRSVLAVKSQENGSLFTAAAKPTGTRVMPAKVANEVASAMEQVVYDGTGRAAQQTFPVYGKTGTTDDFTNAWFTGCTHTLCITVWMGYDRPYVKSGGKIVAHELKSSGGAPVYGGTIPAEIFAKTYADYRFVQNPSASPLPTAPATPYVAPSSTPSTTPTKSATPTKTPHGGKSGGASPRASSTPSTKHPTSPTSGAPSAKPTPKKSG